MRNILFFLLILSARANAQPIAFKALIGPKLPDNSYPASLSRMIVASNGAVFTSGSGGVFRSADQGSSWSRLSQYATGGMEFSPTDSTLYIAGEAGCFSSSDQGNNWKSLNEQLPSTAFYSIAVDHKGNLFTSTLSQVYRSLDKGTTWERIATNITAAESYAWYIHTTPTDALLLDASYEFHRSTNAGDSWQNVPQAPHFQYIATDPNLLVGGGYTSGEFLRSTTDGLAWQLVKTGHTDDFIDAISLDSYGRLFAGSNYFGETGHLFSSKDSGRSWSRDPTTDPDFGCMAFAPNNYLFLGTHNYGAYRSLQYVSAVRNGIANAGEQSLMYPNPASSYSTVRYSLQSPGLVTLRLTDETGHVVWQQATPEVQETGEHEIRMDASNLLPGIYTARLVAGKQVDVAKFVVVR